MGQGASEKDSASTVVKGFVGGSVILSLNISVDAEIEHITWSGPKEAFALALPSGKIFWLDKNYQGRINIPESNYLSINNLTLKDAGSYKAWINQKGSKDIDERFILYIYEQLQEPQVTIQSVNMSENASCTITLGMRSWTLSLRLPGTPPTAALTAMGRLRRMRRGQGCTSPSMEETGCVTRSLRKKPDLTWTLRAKQSMISSLQMTWHQRLSLKGKRCTHTYSLICRLCHHCNRMTLSLLKYLPMKMSPEKKSSYLPQ